MTSEDQSSRDEQVVITAAGLDSSLHVAKDPPNRRAEKIHCESHDQTNFIVGPSNGLPLKVSNIGILLKTSLASESTLSSSEAGSIWPRVRNWLPPFSLLASSSRYLFLSVLTI